MPNSGIFLGLVKRCVGMGNIRTKDIKKASFQLISMYPERFSPDFENNKHVINEVNPVDTKIVRNKLAGYITRVMKRKSAM